MPLRRRLQFVTLGKDFRLSRNHRSREVFELPVQCASGGYEDDLGATISREMPDSVGRSWTQPNNKNAGT